MNRFIYSKHYNEGISFAGAKAKGLVLLKKNGFLCPDFYLIDSLFIADIIWGKSKLNDELQLWISEENIDIKQLWAVRSSSTVEDGNERSFAGQFNTEINVATSNLAEAITSVLKSYPTCENSDYESVVKSGNGIIIQKMIMPDYSGVIFSHNPDNQKDDSVFVSLIPGLGANLVSGKEEGYSIRCKSGKYLTDDDNNVYRGEKFENELYSISRTGIEIKNDVQKFLPDLVKGVRKLSKLKACAVDVEFSIADGKLFWLQVRPVTTGKEETFIWDNTAAESNYPGILLPLSISLINISFSKAYRGLAGYLGMPRKLLKHNELLLNEMTGEIYGGLYYNVTAWQLLLAQLPFGKRISNALPAIWGMENADFYPDKIKYLFLVKLKILLKLMFSVLSVNRLRNKYQREYNKIFNKIDDIQLANLSHSELISVYNELEAKMINNWTAPVLNNLITVILMMISGRLIKKSALNDLYPNFLNDCLIAQSNVISVKIVKEFKTILIEIKEDPELYKMFRTNEPAFIFKQLSDSKKDVVKKISDFVASYGDRSDDPELKMETITYKEDPVKFIAYLKENLSANVDMVSGQSLFDYRSILQQHYKWNLFRRFLILFVVNQTVEKVADREQFRFMRTKTYGLVRRIFREIDNKMLIENKIESKNDSLYLNLVELLNPATQVDLKELIAHRKTLWLQYPELSRAVRYQQKGDKFLPVETNIENNSDLIIKGKGCCSGIIQAEVRIFNDDFSVTDDVEGKIFIANYFEPGKLGLFSRAAGLISARGNLLGHTAILCREMGLPSIVGAKNIINRINNGDIVEMNGSTGTIKIIKRNE